MLTNLYIGNAQQYDEAEDQSKQINSKSIWKIYARYNLGVSLMEDGHYEQGRRLLDRIGQIEARSPEMLALRDRANLSLGLKQLRMELPDTALESSVSDSARGTVEQPCPARVRLGMVSPGQAFEQAQTPWRLLLQRNAVDAATQEAILAIPANYAESGSGQARLAPLRNCGKTV